MDPLCLIASLALVVTTLQGQYDAYAKLQGTKQDSLTAFRRAASRLQDDLKMYQTLIQDVYERATVGGFDVKGSISSRWSIFESALAKAEQKYRELSNTETLDAVRGKGGIINGLIPPLIHSGELTQSIKRIDAATASLGGDIENIERAFKNVLSSFILLHEIQTLRSTPLASPTTPDPFAYARARDDVISAFYHHPFHLSRSCTSTESLFKLNQHRDVAERVTGDMREQGASWVERSESSDSVEGLRRCQTKLMELLWSLSIPYMESKGLGFSRSMADERLDLGELGLGLKSAIARGKSQKFSIAFCGMTKAGKSLFLNALMGRAVLPSDELPSTAWPCRLRHVAGQSVPRLTFDPEPFRIGIEKLQEHKFGSKLDTYQPPTDNDPFADIFDKKVPNSTKSEDLAGIYNTWKKLPKQTRRNLCLFEDPGFTLLSCAEGGTQVTELLGQLNDVVRLCHRFQLGFSFHGGAWPLLCVEFESLRGRQVDGIFEFIDLPGLGEGSDAFTFEELITSVATEANAVVPIVSFKEIAKSDWRTMSRIISSGLETRASLVICTHLDQISQEHLEEQHSIVAQVFWPDSPHILDRVVSCSSKIGLSAGVLRRLSAQPCTTFEKIFDPTCIGYPCALKILGEGKPRAAYDAMGLESWQKAVKHQWERSGLPDALRRLTSDMVDQATQRVLVSEGIQFHKQIRKINSSQQRVLLEMRRTKNELELAREDFQQARTEFTDTLNTWSREEQRQDLAYNERLASGIQNIRNLAKQYVKTALDDTMSEKIRDSTAGESSRVFVGSKREAEEFFRESQQKLAALLLDLKFKFVATVREFAERANRDRVGRLKTAIKAFKDDMEAELRSDILVDLEALTTNIRELAFHSIQKGLKIERIRYTPGDIYKIIEGAVVKPILAFQDDIVDDMTPETTINDLGLLLRAPITVITVIPFVLSAGVWICMTKAKKYHCKLSDLADVYQDKIVAKFLNDLEKESSKSLKSALAQSSAAAKATVEFALQREDARYERERKEKDKMPSQEDVAELIASHLNFVAAEGALLELKRRLEKFVK